MRSAIGYPLFAAPAAAAIAARTGSLPREFKSTAERAFVTLRCPNPFARLYQYMSFFILVVTEVRHLKSNMKSGDVNLVMYCTGLELA
ncbi:MAG: hypothetical protein AAB427_08710 [Chloroflexota bacterium]